MAKGFLPVRFLRAALGMTSKNIRSF